MTKTACTAALLLLTLMLAAPPATGATARDMYQAAMAKEQALRAAATAGSPRTTAASYRSVASAYEQLVRRHHRSGYADNALWQAATLLADAFQRFGETRDRDRASHLLSRLVAEYPTSRLVSSATDKLAYLKGLASAAPGSEPKSVASPDVKPPAETQAPKPASPKVSSQPAPALTAASRAALLKDIRRVSLPDVVRVTIELDQEVAYRTERVENPSRVLFDLAGTQLGTGLREGSKAFTDDVVKHVRIGRHPNTVIRVVLDLDGVKNYSVFTLYSPFRIVVDCVRDQAAPAVVSRERLAEEPAVVPVTRDPAELGHEDQPVLPTTREAKEPAPTAATTPTSRAAVPPAAAPARATGSLASRLPLRSRPIGWHSIPLPSAAATPYDVLFPPLEARALPRRWTTLAPRAPQPSATSLPVSTQAAVSPSPIVARDPAPSAERPTAPEAGPNGYSLARQLGLGASRIVLDPGHGGHDPGAEGPGIFESQVVLDVALRLEKLLRGVGNDVVMTRRTDEFIPLEERTAIANRAQGDLFVSIHANASRNRSARGVETYYLNFATNPEAEAVAARENAATGRTMSNLPDIVKAITLNNKLDESKALAGLVQKELANRLKPAGGAARHHGVKQAPFVVLIGASMPSVLVEISFITNREEGRLLKSASYRQKVAEALFNGIKGYQKSLKGTARVATQ